MRRTNVILWTIQGLLALAFLFAGSMKLLTPAATLAQMAGSVPVLLIRFTGVCESRVRSASSFIMSGAVSAEITLGRAADATAAAILGILAIIVTYGRRR